MVGLVALLVLLASTVINYWLTPKWPGAIESGMGGEVAWKQALGSVMPMLIGLDAWIGCIVARVTDRGAGFGKLGVWLGVIGRDRL